MCLFTWAVHVDSAQTDIFFRLTRVLHWLTISKSVKETFWAWFWKTCFCRPCRGSNSLSSSGAPLHWAMLRLLSNSTSQKKSDPINNLTDWECDGWEIGKDFVTGFITSIVYLLIGHGNSQRLANCRWALLIWGILMGKDLEKLGPNT